MSNSIVDGIGTGLAIGHVTVPLITPADPWKIHETSPVYSYSGNEDKALSQPSLLLGQFFPFSSRSKVEWTSLATCPNPPVSKSGLGFPLNQIVALCLLMEERSPQFP